MAYPERGATYQHKPKFMERALEAEHRDSGGDVSAKHNPSDQINAPLNASSQDAMNSPFLNAGQQALANSGMGDVMNKMNKD